MTIDYSCKSDVGADIFDNHVVTEYSYKSDEVAVTYHNHDYDYACTSDTLDGT